MASDEVKVALIEGAALVVVEAIRSHGLGSDHVDGIVTAFISAATKALRLHAEAN